MQVCSYISVDMKMEKGNCEIEKCEYDLNDHLINLEKEKQIILMIDMDKNARVGKDQVGNMIRKQGVNEIKEIGQHVVDIIMY